MGIAIIIPDISFSELNIGQVTPVGNNPLVSLSISGDDSVVGGEEATSYTVGYNPANTTQRAIAWSVVSGGEYATIDQLSGVLSVLQGASQNNVTIRVSSVDNPSITAEKQIVVTYSAAPGPDPGYTPLEDLTERVYSNSSGHYITDITLDSTDKIKFKFTKFGGGTSGVLLGSRTSGTADDNSTMVEFGKFGIGYAGIKLKIAGKFHYSGQEMSQNTTYLVAGDATELITTPSLGNSVAGSDYAFSAPLPIAIMGLYLANGSVTDRPNMDFYGLEIYSQAGLLKHRLIPQSDLTLLDEVTNVTYQPVGTLQYVTE